MPDREKIAARLRTRRCGRMLYCLQSVGSTNDYLWSLPAPADGTAAIADEQTAGRGRRGHTWASGRGEAVQMSVYLRPEPAVSPVLSLVCGLAAAGALERLCGGGFGIKWPNDIVCDGKKLGGILCEARLSGAVTQAVCGIGVNLRQGRAFFEQCGLPDASSVALLRGVSPSCEETAAAILNELEKWLDASREMGVPALLTEYAHHCVTLGREVCARTPDGEVTGTAERIAPDGALVIRTSYGPAVLRAGEVSVRGIMGYV